jgi:Ca2+-binding EF-hand superfamily protein
MMDAAEMDRQLETSSWLRKHGRAVRPHLNREQKKSLQECFELIDADGSGGLDLLEMQQVFEASTCLSPLAMLALGSDK